MTAEISKAQLLDEMRGFIKPERREEILREARRKRKKELPRLVITTEGRRSAERMLGGGSH